MTTTKKKQTAAERRAALWAEIEAEAIEAVRRMTPEQRGNLGVDRETARKAGVEFVPFTPVVEAVR